MRQQYAHLATRRRSYLKLGGSRTTLIACGRDLGSWASLVENQPDGVATVFIGLLLVVVAVVLAIETKSLLIGESASEEHVARIREAAVTPSGVERIIHMRTLHLGPEELLVALKIGVSRDAQAADVAEAIDEAERNIRAAVPIAIQVS